MYHQIESAADISQLLQVQFICRATPTGVHGQQGMETDGQESYRGGPFVFFLCEFKESPGFCIDRGGLSQLEDAMCNEVAAPRAVCY